MKKASIIILQLFCLVVFLSISANAQSNCTYTLSSQFIRLPVSGGGGVFNVITQPGCPWSATSNRPWISLTGATTGTGNGQITFNVAQNTAALRGGSITVAGQTFDIIQDTSCVFTTTPAFVNLPASGGQGSVVVNLPPGCIPTTLGSLNSWIDVTSLTGSGDTRTAFYTVEPNTGPARTGTIVFGESISPPGGFFTINQASDCTYSLSPISIQAEAAGGDTGFNLTTQTGCNWAAASNVNWITVSNTTGMGSGRINYSIQSNTGAPRQGTITAGGQTFTINQYGQAVQPTLISPGGLVLDRNSKPVRNAIVTFTNTSTGEARTVATNPFGHFRFGNIQAGQAYTVTIAHKRYKFSGTRTNTFFIENVTAIYMADPE